MSNSRNYTITTLRNSVRQHGSASLGGTVVANNQVPFSFSPFTARIRDSGVPYVTGPETATDLNLRRTIRSGGGGGSVTAAENLVHWWKMTENVAGGTVIDYGLNASSGVTDLTLIGGTTETSAGPTENGSPNAISFNGTSDAAWVYIYDAVSSATSVGTLIDTGGNWSISMWIKDDATTHTNYSSYFVATTADNWIDGVGAYYFSNTSLWAWLSSYSANKAIISNSVPHSGWRNIIITYDAPADPLRKLKVYYNGYLSGSYDSHLGGVDTSFDTTNASTKFSFGAYVRANGTTNYNMAITGSDIRLYNKVLTTDEISAIAAGDWT